MDRLGALRWRIEAFFKTMKHRFSAARFTFRRLKAVLRWFFFCWLAYLLSYWIVLAQGTATQLDWRAAAQAAAECFFGSLLLFWHEQEAFRLRDLIQAKSTFALSFLEVT